MCPPLLALQEKEALQKLAEAERARALQDVAATTLKAQVIDDRLMVAIRNSAMNYQWDLHRSYWL